MNAPRTIAISLAVVAASSAMLVAGCGGGTTLDLTVRNDKRTVVDLTVAGANQGDLLAVNGDLIDAGGKAIGAFHLAAAVVRTTRTREVRGTNAYISWTGSPDSLVFAGAPEYPAGGGRPTEPIRFAVVGGTGQYSGTSGQATVTVTKPDLFTWRIELE